MSLATELQQYIASQNQLRKGEGALLAVSGGVDSMVMAHLFREAGIAFAVAHCNFQLRGAEADKDETLVQQWCTDYNIAFYNVRFDTQAVAEQEKTGIQETARTLRYTWLESLRKTHKWHKIATAHHLDDNVETVLMNMLRGTGIAGMHGILPVNGKIIRPLLFARKEELLEYAKANAVPYREDASNASDYYTRNIIRHHIVPAMEQYFPGAAGRIQETIGHLAEAEILYNKAIDLERKKLLEQRGNDYYVPINKLVLRQPLSTIVYELMRNFGFHASQTPEVIKLLSAESGHYIVSGTHRIIRNRDFLVITTLAPETADMVVIDQLPATITAGDYTYRFEITERPPELDPDKNIAWLNMAAVEYPILLRKWKTGDYFYPLGMDMKKKKVSRMLINDKVALHEKEKIMVLESGRRIAWVAGMRIDERFKVKPTTEKVLKISREPYSPSK